jgi:hypothetical protein
MLASEVVLLIVTLWFASKLPVAGLMIGVPTVPMGVDMVPTVPLPPLVPLTVVGVDAGNPDLDFIQLGL